MSDSNSIIYADSGWTQRDQCTYGGNKSRVQNFLVYYAFSEQCATKEHIIILTVISVRLYISPYTGVPKRMVGFHCRISPSVFGDEKRNVYGFITRLSNFHFVYRALP
jgi:hypothetical protein